MIATLFLIADDADSLLGTPANLGGFLLGMLFILLLSIFLLRQRATPTAGGPVRVGGLHGR